MGFLLIVFSTNQIIYILIKTICNFAITQLPESTNEVKVEYLSGFVTGFDDETGKGQIGDNIFTETKPTILPVQYGSAEPFLIIKLTLQNPDQSLESFDADVSFSITKA